VLAVSNHHALDAVGSGFRSVRVDVAAASERADLAAAADATYERR
jgi:hypothetical protein